jgi:hypothetical protein
MIVAGGEAWKGIGRGDFKFSAVRGYANVPALPLNANYMLIIKN